MSNASNASTQRISARLWGRWGPPAELTGTLALLRLLPSVSAPLTASLTALVLAASLLPIAVTVASGLLVGSIPAAVHGGLSSPAGQHTIRLLGAVALLLVLARLIGPFQAALAGVFSRAVDRALQTRVMAAVAAPAGIGHLEDPAVLDRIKNAEGVGTTGLTPGLAVRSLASLLPSWFQALGSAAVLLGFHWQIGLAWLIMYPLMLGVLQGEFLRVGQTAHGQAAAVRRSDYFRELAIRPGAAKELRLWGMLDWLIDRFDAAWHEAMRPIWRTRDPGRPVLWATAGVLAAFNLGTLGLLAAAALRGDLALAALAVYTNAVTNASGFRAFDDANSNLAYAIVSIPSILALERRLGGERLAEPSAAPSPGGPLDAIRFESVTFRYPGQQTEVLADLDLAIPAGRSLAIVGANGAGKTTLVKLLCRLYEPTSGQITADGVDLRTYDASSWQRLVTAVFQDFAQYELPARDNVGLGAPALAPDLGRLREAARQAGALALIEGLPRGWETILSRRYTGGVDLSGGQWQRIALARALFAAQGGARVLILDEPTASLDVRAEADLYDRFLEITAGLTTVLISHRFSTVRRADHIVVLEHGRVVEQGSHDALVAADGRYARMFALQAAHFVDEADAAFTIDEVESVGGGD